MKKYLNPKSDPTFKKVFGEHKELLISMLNAMLPLSAEQEIVDLEYLSPELVPVKPDKKDSVVDVRCRDVKGRQFLVEMQMYWTDAFKKRALLNTCKAYSQPAERGMDYRELKPVYTLSLVDDIAFPELEGEFYHVYVPTNRNHSDYVIDDVVMIFIELPKFNPQQVQDKKMMQLWLRYFTEIDERTREVSPELMEDKLVSKALSLVEESAYTDSELQAIDRYWDMVSRERTALGEALDMGIAKGKAEGRAEGRAEEKLSNARALKANGVPADIIASSLGLDVETVNGLNS